MVIISLGSDCSVTYQLQKHHFREKAFPFDWIRISFLDVIKLIENKFEDMFDDIYFKRKSENFKFVISNSEESKETKEGFIYGSKKYPSLEFCHDFKGDQKDNLLEVIEKYKRRIDRFFELKENVSFVHWSDKPIPLSFLIRWEQLINKPLYIIGPFEQENYNQIHFIQHKDKFTTWHRNEFDWLNLFNQINRL